MKLAARTGLWQSPLCAAQDQTVVADLEQAGFILAPGGKGSHRKFRHPKLPGSLIVSGQSGEDAHHYQEKQVRNAIRESSK